MVEFDKEETNPRWKMFRFFFPDKNVMLDEKICPGKKETPINWFCGDSFFWRNI
jgi:hypothetical protein